MEGEISGGKHTLYVNNLYEKISQDDLKKAMRCIFEQFGNIIDVVSRKTYKLRGQAWVVFDNAEDAKKAMEAMQGFPFFNKPIRITLAKTKSDAVAKIEGSFDEAAVEERKQRRKAAREAQKAAAPSAAAGPGAPSVAAAAPPTANCTLFVENLPNEANEGMLLLVFQRFPGLKEIRMVPHKPGIAFVEYDNETGAEAALAGLQGFKLATDKPMILSFSKQ